MPVAARAALAAAPRNPAFPRLVHFQTSGNAVSFQTETKIRDTPPGRLPPPRPLIREDLIASFKATSLPFISCNKITAALPGGVFQKQMRPLPPIFPLVYSTQLL